MPSEITTAPESGEELSPTWTSSAKDMVVTSLGSGRTWATLGHGILNEVYWPSTGEPQIRDLGFIVAGPHGWIELKRAANYTVSTPEPAIPLPTVVHHGEGWQLTLEVIPDPDRDTVLIRHLLEGEGCGLYVLLAPRLGQKGDCNIATAGTSLQAQADGLHLCLASDRGYQKVSAGFVGSSDGWQDFSRDGAMTLDYRRSGPGNVALTGALPAGEGTLALAFSGTAEGAVTLARSALAAGFASIRIAAFRGWSDWAAKVSVPSVPGLDDDLVAQARQSAAVIKVHEDRTFPGAVVASLSIPWGNARNDLGGYHLVWARDAVNSGLGLLAIGQVDDARRMLSYLAATQDQDGRWGQNFYPDGTVFWTGLQLDEVGLPIILAQKLVESGGLDPQDAGREGLVRMVRRAAGFILRSGPISEQDRWEENTGLNAYTLSVLVAALVAAGEWLSDDERDLVLATADDWNARIEDWLFVTDSDLARDYGVLGHYIRLAPRGDVPPDQQAVEVRNRGGLSVPAADLVAMDFLALSRFGLRAADAPAMRDTLTVCDAVLGIDTPQGRTFHRYNHDGYGEKADGSPFDGQGIGRGWPLLSGERGHHALQAGGDPVRWLRAMQQMTGPCGMIPEQVWDSAPIPNRFLRPGRPSGSAMPLVWAHSEYLRLAVAICAGRPLELLDCMAARYAMTRPTPAAMHWRTATPVHRLPRGTGLRIVDTQPFTLHASTDGWATVGDIDSVPMPFGLFVVTPDLGDADSLVFTRRYGEDWEGVDHRVEVA